MLSKKYLFLYISYLLVGAVLIGLSFAGLVDEFWNGMGSALLIVGALRLLRMYRLRSNTDYRERVETEATDERNRFIRNKAWAWSAYIYMLTAAAATIILRVIGLDMWSLAASYSVCFMLVVFWISYWILRKKY